jgi:hypothetical protein
MIVLFLGGEFAYFEKRVGVFSEKKSREGRFGE